MLTALEMPAETLVAMGEMPAETLGTLEAMEAVVTVVAAEAAKEGELTLEEFRVSGYAS